MRLARLRERLSRDEGVSLVEMMMVMALLALVLAVTLTAFNSMELQAASSDSRLQNLDEARTLIAVATKDLRTATPLAPGTSPFLLADANEVIFYGNVDPTVRINNTWGPNKVRFYIDRTNPNAPVLVEQTTAPDSTSVPPNWTYTTNPARVRLVGKYIINAGSQPVFTYYDDDRTVLSATPLNASDLLSVKAVGITFVVRRSAAQYLPSTTITNTVTLPNIYYQLQS